MAEAHTLTWREGGSPGCEVALNPPGSLCVETMSAYSICDLLDLRNREGICKSSIPFLSGLKNDVSYFLGVMLAVMSYSGRDDGLLTG